MSRKLKISVAVSPTFRLKTSVPPSAAWYLVPVKRLTPVRPWVLNSLIAWTPPLPSNVSPFRRWIACDVDNIRCVARHHGEVGRQADVVDDRSLRHRRHRECQHRYCRYG